MPRLFSQVTKSNPITATNLNLNIEKDTTSKILTCILLAHMNNIGEPGSFEQALQDNLRDNNLPVIKVSKTPNSRKILEMAGQSNPTRETEANETETNVEVTDQEHLSLNPTQTESIADQDEEKINGQEIGLAIIAPRSTGFPEHTLTRIGLKDGLEKGKYKWVYTDNSYDETFIYDNIIHDRINLQGCWKETDDTKYKKLRTGLHAEKTPPPSKLTKRF